MQNQFLRFRPRDVALRKESVDRNTNFSPASLFDLPVALRKESVDRNKLGRIGNHSVAKSLSARRAWIEIALVQLPCGPCLSLSARRAWIEMMLRTAATRRKKVALRKESVDRNLACFAAAQKVAGRSPQGERG